MGGEDVGWEARGCCHEKWVSSRRVGAQCRGESHRRQREHLEVCTWIQLYLKPPPSLPTVQMRAMNQEIPLLPMLVPVSSLFPITRVLTNTRKRSVSALGGVGYRHPMCLSYVSYVFLHPSTQSMKR